VRLGGYKTPPKKIIKIKTKIFMKGRQQGIDVLVVQRGCVFLCLVERGNLIYENVLHLSELGQDI
jgi:hypothetical protein